MIARLLVALAMLPACWGLALAAVDAVAAAARASSGVSHGLIAFAGGTVACLAVWLLLPHPMRAYVLGHELTHALWGLLFGARASKLRVTKSGGSVNLTKTNFVIALAPYFFPFYTFLAIVAAFATRLAFGRLPMAALWAFVFGLTWAFHFLFTLATLSSHQSDVAAYGRVFSWTFIFAANLIVILVALAAASDLAVADLAATVAHRTAGAYSQVFSLVRDSYSLIVERFHQ